MSSPSNHYEQGLAKNSANYQPLTPLGYLTKAALTYPDKTAIIDRERRLTYREMNGRCIRLASALDRLGVGVGDTVSVMSPNAVALLEAHYGVPMTGAVLNAINYRLDPPTIAFILEHTQTKVLLTDREFSPVIAEALSLSSARPLVVDIDDAFTLKLQQHEPIAADIVVNAAGPFAGRVAAMLGETLPVKNLFQQKLAFEDTRGAIPRDMPFSIDLDEKTLGWSDEERELLASDSRFSWLTEKMPGGTHCRPEGGIRGKWVKLGWAYNEQDSEAQPDLANEPLADPRFPEIVMRGAAQFVPALQRYIDTPPTRYSHYGGYYTMTEENWPRIGPMQADGAFMVAALSGFGSMAACAAGPVGAAGVTTSPARHFDSVAGNVGDGPETRRQRAEAAAAAAEARAAQARRAGGQIFDRVFGVDVPSEQVPGWPFGVKLYCLW